MKKKATSLNDKFALLELEKQGYGEKHKAEPEFDLLPCVFAVCVSRSAKEAEDKIKKALDKGEVLPTEARFDSNCITPGRGTCDLYENNITPKP